MIGLVSRRIRCERVAGKDRKRGRDGSFNLLMEWALMTPELMDLAQIGPADSFGYQLYSMHTWYKHKWVRVKHHNGKTRKDFHLPVLSVYINVPGKGVSMYHCKITRHRLL